VELNIAVRHQSKYYGRQLNIKHFPSSEMDLS